MNSKLMYLAMFTAGAAIGSVVTWKFAKEKYERLAQEEIESVKKVFSNFDHNDDSKVEEVNVKEEPKSNNTAEMLTYKDIVKRYDYTKYSAPKEEPTNVERPYVIPPEEFGELDGYETISLTYYADDYLTDDMDELVDDVEDVVGYDSLEHFGEYEDDSVFVRNDAKRCDYEILRVEKNYRDVVN